MAIISHGRVLMTGDPLENIAAIEGKVWKKVISRSDLEAHQGQYAVISTKLVAGRTVIHVYSEEQPEGFEPVTASLEDVYFSTLHHAAAAEKAA
jgi:hypothetical protein